MTETEQTHTCPHCGSGNPLIHADADCADPFHPFTAGDVLDLRNLIAEFQSENLTRLRALPGTNHGQLALARSLLASDWLGKRVAVSYDEGLVQGQRIGGGDMLEAAEHEASVLAERLAGSEEVAVSHGKAVRELLVLRDRYRLAWQSAARRAREWAALYAAPSPQAWADLPQVPQPVEEPDSVPVEPGSIGEPTEPGWYAYDGGRQTMIFHLRENEGKRQWSAHFDSLSCGDCEWGYIEQALGEWSLVRLDPSPVLSPPETLARLVEQWGPESVRDAFDITRAIGPATEVDLPATMRNGDTITVPGPDIILTEGDPEPERCGGCGGVLVHGDHSMCDPDPEPPPRRSGVKTSPVTITEERYRPPGKVSVLTGDEGPAVCPVHEQTTCDPAENGCDKPEQIRLGRRLAADDDWRQGSPCVSCGSKGTFGEPGKAGCRSCGRWDDPEAMS